MEIKDIVYKLIGPINPVGETHTDDKRFENLKVMTQLVDDLLTDINNVACMDDSHEFSVKRAAKFCSDFYDQINIQE